MIEIEIFPTAMASAMTRLLKSIVDTGALEPVVPPAASTWE